MTQPPPSGGTILVSDVQEIAAPSPKITGGVRVAPLGTALPTDATTDLDVLAPGAYVNLGRVSDTGVDRTEERPNTEINDWGGDLIAVLQDKYGITLKFKLLQLMNADVQAAAHGVANVSTGPSPGPAGGTLITAKMNAQLLNYGSWVIDAYYMKMSMRLVVPYGRITLVGPLKWVHKELAAYDLTLKPFPDTNNNHAYEYWDDGGSVSGPLP